ncbi:MAG: OmpA family protein [Treponema sp.]|nr:OmpA family protein [Treponema sp.]
MPLILAVSLVLFSPSRTGAQEVRLGAGGAGAYTMVERSDWSRYDNGKYTGHVYHEVRASIKPELAGNGDSGAFLYRGNFFVLEETLRNMSQSARPVDTIIPVSFKIFRDGNLVIDEDRGYPSLRGFPAFPSEAVTPGATWEAQGQRAVDPKNSGTYVLVPFIANYEYRGMEQYREMLVHRVTAKYALRYQGPGLGQDFSAIQGTHTADILIHAANGLPLMIRDNLDETYSWPDGATLRFRGFTLIFNQGAVPINRDTVIASMGDALGIAAGKGGAAATSATRPPAPTEPPRPAPARPPAPPEQPRPAPADNRIADSLGPAKGLDLVSVPEGVRLIVRDIRFAPDSDEFLSEERPRLDLIAQALAKAAPDQQFLVEGHTASIGRPAGEMELSIQRAKRMVEELARRGIPENRFIYKGWGGTRPIGDNSVEQGRALNRRVEITILD